MTATVGGLVEGGRARFGGSPQEVSHPVADFSDDGSDDAVVQLDPVAARTSVATRVKGFFKPVADRYARFRTPAPEQGWEEFLKEKAKVGFTVADRLRYAYIDYRNAEGFFASAKAWILGGGLGALVAGSMDELSNEFKALEKQSFFYKDVCKAERCFAKLVRNIPLISTPNRDKLEKAMEAFELLLRAGRQGSVYDRWTSPGAADAIHTIINKRAGVESVSDILLGFFAEFAIGASTEDNILAFAEHANLMQILREKSEAGYRGAITSDQADKDYAEVLEPYAAQSEDYPALMMSLSRGVQRAVLKDEKSRTTFSRAVGSLGFREEMVDRQMKQIQARENQQILELLLNPPPEDEDYECPAGVRAETMEEMLKLARDIQETEARMSDCNVDIAEKRRAVDAAVRARTQLLAQTTTFGLADMAELFEVMDADEIRVDASKTIFKEAREQYDAYQRNSAEIARLEAKIEHLKREEVTKFKDTAKQQTEALGALQTQEADLSDARRVAKQLEQKGDATLAALKALDANQARATKVETAQVRELQEKQARIREQRFSYANQELLKFARAQAVGHLQPMCHNCRPLRTFVTDVQERDDGIGSLRAAQAEISKAAGKDQQLVDQMWSMLESYGLSEVSSDGEDGVVVSEKVMDFDYETHNRGYLEDRREGLRQSNPLTRGHLHTFYELSLAGDDLTRVKHVRESARQASEAARGRPLDLAYQPILSTRRVRPLLVGRPSADDAALQRIVAPAAAASLGRPPELHTPTMVALPAALVTQLPPAANRQTGTVLDRDPLLEEDD